MADATGKKIVLVGMMGAGKTAVGGELARRLGLPLIDSDHEIESAANATIAEIFAQHGEPFFRAKEHQVLDRLLDGPPCVLSTGGGVFLSPDNRDLIAGRGVSVWLDVPIPILWARVRNKPTRPLLMTTDPLGTLTRLETERRPVYQLADLAVPTGPNVTIPEMADRVLAALRARPDAARITGLMPKEARP